MPRFYVREEVIYGIDAPDAQTALDSWVNAGTEAVASVAVEERSVTDDRGRPCEVEDQ